MVSVLCILGGDVKTVLNHKVIYKFVQRKFLQRHTDPLIFSSIFYKYFIILIVTYEKFYYMPTLTFIL